MPAQKTTRAERTGNTGKEGGQVTAHRQTRAEASDNTPNHRLSDADTATRHTQLYVIGPKRRGETAAEHAEDHHTVDTRQRRPFPDESAYSSPTFQHERQRAAKSARPQRVNSPVTAQKVPVMPK
ncbi:Uncharacterised protein [Salmonella bongori]|nr:Uncharacterised protein [Salmonella bongori]